MPLRCKQQRAVRHPPQTHLTQGRPGRQEGAVGAERKRCGVGERFGQHRLGQVGTRQAGILRLHPLQVGVPDGEM